MAASFSFMDGCMEAGEAQCILQGSFDENFSETSWESCATSSQLRHKYGAPAPGGLRLFVPARTTISNEIVSILIAFVTFR